MKPQLLILQPHQAPNCNLAESLTRLQFAVTTMTDPDQAMVWTRQNQPNLVFVKSAISHNCDGFCESLKFDQQTNLIPIWVLKGAEEDQSSVPGIQISPNGRLNEPFTLEDLRQAILEARDWRSRLEQERIANEICFQLPSMTSVLEELTQILAKLFVRAGFSTDQVKRLQIAIRELGINAIEWGHRKDAKKTITVIFRLAADRISLLIRDTGSGFDRNRIPHAARPGDPVGHLEARQSLGLREGGFGILLAKGLVDNLQYNNRGNEVCLVKYLPAAVPVGETA